MKKLMKFLGGTAVGTLILGLLKNAWDDNRDEKLHASRLSHASHPDKIVDDSPARSLQVVIVRAINEPADRVDISTEERTNITARTRERMSQTAQLIRDVLPGVSFEVFTTTKDISFASGLELADQLDATNHAHGRDWLKFGSSADDVSLGILEWLDENPDWSLTPVLVTHESVYRRLGVTDELGPGDYVIHTIQVPLPQLA